MNVLMLVASSIEQSSECRDRLRYWPSTSLTRHGDEARYVYSAVDPRTFERTSNVAIVQVTEPMALAFNACREGARLTDIAEALCGRFPGLAPEAARAFVDELTDRQMLVSRLVPPLSSESPLDDIAAGLESIGIAAECAPNLRTASRAFAKLNAQPLGCAPSEYENIEKQISSLPRAPGALQHIFHVDLHYDGTAPTLRTDVAARIGSGAELLFRIASSPPHRALQLFRERFVERYGQRRIRLVDALDQERGLGFDDNRWPAVYDSALFADLGMDGRSRPANPTLDSRESWMFKRAGELAAEHETTWTLTDEDITMLAGGQTPPDAFACLVTVLAQNPRTLANGQCKLLIRSAGGPAGANTLGRFCLGSPTLRRHVADHLGREQAMYQEDLLAEIVHWPRGNTGNILIRPSFRDYEIVYLATPSSLAENVLTADDLLVSVRNGEFVLESERLGRRIRPRMANAHSVRPTELPLYQFLAALRDDNRAGYARWDWSGPLQYLPYLPRVVRDEYVFAEACWNITGEALRQVTYGPINERAERFNALRQKRGIPRWVTVGAQDRWLTLDLDNALCVELLVEEARDHDEVLVVREMLPSLDDRCVVGPEGTYAHEITLPFLRNRLDAAPSIPLARRADVCDRIFPPGSRWLTLQLYMGAAGVDRVLMETIAPFLQEEHGIARWFFIRYGDPDWHLRFRIEAEPQALWGKLLPALYERLSPALDSGLVRRIKVDTYEREVERYGGSKAIDLVETVFHADSQAVLAILPMLEGDEEADARWHLALRGVHDILKWFEFDLSELVEITGAEREGLSAAIGAGPIVGRRIGAFYRAVHHDIEGLVGATPDSEHPYHLALMMLEERGARVRELVACINQLGLDRIHRRGIAVSLSHMFVNRLVMSDHRRHELLLYDLLWRVYRGKLARGA